jgi:DNA-directed RNA polymerase subunit D
MEIDIEEISKTQARLKISESTPNQVNSIRRVLMSDIPKMAIEDVEFHLGSVHDDVTGKDYDLSTSLFDEAIALRLGLLPIPTNLKQFRFKDKCTCKGEGCAHCQIIYTIDRKGPGTVYSRDLVPLGDPDLAIADPNIPVVTLGAKQALLVYATAIMGTARQHSKWQVANAVGYSYQPKVKFTKQSGCTDACMKRMDEVCPTHVFKFSPGSLKVVAEDQCILCKECEKVCSHGSVKIETDPTTFLFRMETDSSLSAREAFRLALEQLTSRFDELRDAVTALS